MEKANSRAMAWAAGLAGVLLAALALYAWPLALPGFVGHDADRLFLFHPAIEFARGELLAGRVPLWNPYKFMGSPFLANLMVPVFYPPQFLGLLAPQPFGQNMVMLFHALLSAGLAWGCARRGFGVGRAGAALAGLTYAGSAPMFVALTHFNQFYAMAWLPGVLWAALGLGDKNLMRGAATLGAVMGLQGLAGQPQISLYGGVIVACAVMFSAGGGWRSFARAAVSAAMAGALAFGLAGVHLLPGLELSHFSHRQMESADYALSFSLPLKALAGLMAPGFAVRWSGGESGGEALVFFGQIAMTLAGLGLVARWKKPAARLLAVLAGVAVVMALGKNTPAYPALMKLAPILQDFRAPARAFVLVVLAGAMLAGMGLEWIQARSGDRGRVVVALLIAAQFGSLAWNRVVHMPQRHETMAPLDDAGLGGAARFSAAGRVFRLMNEVDYLDTRHASLDEKIWKLQPDANALAGQPDVAGYDEGSLPTLQSVRWFQYYRRNLYTPQPDANLLGLMGVRTVMADKPAGGELMRRAPSLEAAIDAGVITMPKRGMAFARLNEAVAAGEVAILANQAYRGLVFTRADWPEVDFERLDDYKETADPRRDILKPAAPGQGAGSNLPPPPHVQATQAAPGCFDVKILDPATREVILSGTALPGWEAELPGGARVAGRPLAACLMTFEIPAGMNELKLVYRPASFRHGVVASLASLFLLIALGAAGWRKNREINARPADSLE